MITFISALIGYVGPGVVLDPLVGIVTEPDVSRLSDYQLAVMLHDRFLYPESYNRMSLCGIRSNDQDCVGLLDIVRLS